MPFFKRKNDKRLTINDKQSSPTSFPKESLLPTEEIINLAKKAGVDFGPGNAAERIRYFIKLGLLPHAVRKLPQPPNHEPLTINHQPSTSPVGHLPYWTVERLVEINRLNNNGLTFPQIAKKLSSTDSSIGRPIDLSSGVFTDSPILPTHRTTDFTDHTDYTDSPLIVKVVPLTDVNSHEMNQKFKDQQKRLESLIDNKFKSQGQIPVFSNPDSSNTSRASRITKNAILLLTVFSLASGTIFIGAKGYQRFSNANPKATKQVAQEFQASGQVLAASSASHRLYIDADSEFSGTTLFAENITAPNVVYGVTAGTGIAVSAGQNPQVSLDTTAIVPSINDASGPITLKGSGSTSITNLAGVITISSTSATSGITSEADTLSSVTGRGATTSTASSFTGGATIGTSLTLSAFSSSGGVLYTNGSGVLAQVTAGTSSQCLLGGTSPSFGACASGGVTSLDGLTGALTLANSTGSGTTVTIDDATTAAKGIASFSSGNFSVTSGAVSIKTGGVTTTEILDATILTGDIATDTILAGNIAAGAVGSSEILDGDILEIDLKVVDTAADEECLTYEATGGDFEWQSCSSGSVTGSGTSGQIAFFNGTSSITSEASGFGWDTTNKLLTITGSTTLATGTVQTISDTSNSYSTGGLLSLSLTQTAATGTSVSGNIGSIAFSPIYSTAITTPAISGNLLNIARATTTNGTFASTLTVSGAVASISDNCTQTTGTCTNSANVLSLTQSYASATGSVLNVSNSGSGASIAAGNITSTATGTNTQLKLGNITSVASATSYGINLGTISGAGTATYGINLGTNASTATNNYGINIGAISGVSTNNYGIFVGSVANAATLNYALYTTAGNVNFNLATSEQVLVSSPSNSNTSGALLINTSSTNTGSVAIESLLNANLTSAGTQMNLYSTSSASGIAFAGTSTTNNLYGTYSIVAKSSSDNYTTTGGTANFAAGYFSGSNLSGDSGAAGTRNSYGIIAIGTGAATGTTATYGVYAAGNGADTNYALYTSNGNVKSLLGASDTVSIDAVTTTNTGTAGAFNVNSKNTTSLATGIANTTEFDAQAANAVGYGLYNTFTSIPASNANTTTSVGFYNSWNSTTAMTVGNMSQYGIYNILTKTGADTTFSPRNYFGDLTRTNITQATSGTTNNYALYGQADSDTLATNIYNFAVFANATSSSVRNYGIYLNAANGSTSNYALYAEAGNVNIQGLSASLGVYTDANKNLTSTTPTSGALGYWTRTSTTLTPTTANDIVSIANTTTTGADFAITNTGIYTGTGIFNLTADSATTGKVINVSGNGLSSGTLLNLSSTSTAATTDYLINLSSSGTSNSAVRYGLYANMTGTGTTSTNYAAYLTASGATTNYGLYSTSASASNYFESTANTTAVTASNNRLYGGMVNMVSSGSTTGTAAAVISTYNNYTGGAEMATYGLYNNFYSDTGQTLFPYEHYGIYSLMSKSGVDAANIAKNLYGMFSSTSNTSTHVSTSPKTTFAVYGTATSTGSWGAGNVNTYGVYGAATGDSSAASTTYGSMAIASGADTNIDFYGAPISTAGSGSNYGLLLGAISGATTTNYGISLGTLGGGTGSSGYQINAGNITAVASGTWSGINLGTIGGSATTTYGINIAANSATSTTNYGINLAAVSGATTNYALLTAGGNISTTLATSTTQQFLINSTTSTAAAAGVLDINVTSATSDNRAIDLNYTSSNTTAAAKNYGIYASTTRTGDGTNSLYGGYLNFTDAVSTAISGTSSDFGLAINTSGTASLNAATATRNLYGLYNSTSNLFNEAQGTTNTYGIFNSSWADFVGTSTLFGIRNTIVENADTTYSLYTATSALAGGTTSYGIYASGIGGSTTNVQIQTGAITSPGTSLNIDLDLGAISGTANGSSNYGIRVGNISSAGTTTNNYGINLGTLTGGTTANYQISTGALTAIASATNTQLNLGTITSAASSSTYGIKIGAISGTAASSNNYGINIGAMTSTGTANYGIYLGALSGATTSKGIEIGALSSATSTGIDIGTLSGGTSSIGINLAGFTAGIQDLGIRIGTFGISTGVSTGIEIEGFTGNSTNIGIQIGSVDGFSGTGTATGIDIGQFTNTGATQYGLNIGAFSGTHNGGTTAGINIGAISSAGTTTNNYGLLLGTLTGGTTGNYQISTGALTGIAGAINAQINLGAVSTAGTTNYGIFTGNVSGATNNYGIVASTTTAAGNYALYTTAGNIKNILGVTDFVTIDNTAAVSTNSLTTTPTLYVNSKSLTSGNTGANFAYTSTVASSTATQYGLYSNFTSGQNLAGTSQTYTFYGMYGNFSKTGTDAHTTAGTTNGFGVLGIASNTSGDTGGLGTKNTYGGYFSAVGTTNGTGNAYGIYATASGADNPYAGYFVGSSENNTAPTIYVNNSQLTDGQSLIYGNATVRNATTGQYNLRLVTTEIGGAQANTAYGIHNTVTQTNGQGLDNKSIGIYTSVTTSTGNTTTPTGMSSYGALFTASTTVSTANDASFPDKTYGIYASATGATGTGTAVNLAYGIYTTAGGADRNYGIYSSSAAAINQFNSTASTVATTASSSLLYGGTVNIQNSTATGAVSSLNVSTVNTGSTGALATGYGIYNTWTSATALTATAGNIYGIFNKTTKTGVDNTNVVASAYGVYSSATYTGATVGVRRVAGGYFEGIGANDSASPRIQAYGIMGVANSPTSTESSSGNWGVYGSAQASTIGNYAGYFTGTDSNSTASTLHYGVYAGQNITGDVNGTRTAYGLQTLVTNDNTTTDQGTRVAYGIYSSVTGSTRGTNTTYGAYLAAQTGDTNWGLVVAAGSIQLTPIVATSGNVTICQSTTALLKSSAACTGTDYPEYYPVANDVTLADVVELSDIPNPNGDTNAPFLAVKASHPYGDKILGVMSSIHEEDTIDPSGIAKKADYYHLLALAGRVQTKVNGQNGPVAAGDPLTSSSTPGVAMKADPTRGSIIGKALEPYSGPGQGQILVFLENSTRVDLQTAYQNVNLNAQSFATSSNNTVIDALGNITTAGDIITNGELRMANGNFLVDTLGNLTSNTLTANQLNITGDATIGGNLTALSILTSNLKALSSSDLNISLGDSAGSNSLKILDSIGSSLFTLTSSGTATFAGTVNADAFVTHSTADLAEAFPTTDDTISAGDLVATDPNNKEHLTKSIDPYQQTLLGIISTEPGFTLNASQLDAKYLALAGRVPTKVNLENGPIKAGDPITSSSTPGVGMKATQAGRVIGIALENLLSTNNNEPSTITVFVNPSWYTGQSLAQNGSFTAESSQQAPPTNHELLTTNLLNPNGTLASSQNDKPQATKAEIEELVRSEVKRQVGELLASSQVQGASTSTGVDSPVPITAVLGESTSSASINYEPSTTNQSAESSASAAIQEGTQIAAETQQNLDTMNNLLSTMNLKLDTLTLTGASNLAQTQIAGTFSQDGTFVIDYGKQINVLGNTLFLQNDSLAGNCELSTVNCQLLDIGAGAITIDKNGNLLTKGTITAQNIQTKEITVDTADVNAKSAGSATLATGKNQVTIFTTLVKPNAKILITPTTPTGGKQLYVATKSEFEGFTVALDQAVATNKIEFDWLIVNTSLQSKL